MNIRTTTDPISMRDVPDPEHAPCVYEGDGEEGIEIYFENEENRRTYLDMEVEDEVALMGDDSEDYVAEG